MRFGNFGVGTSRAGLSLIMPSRTQYLKNERNAASFRAMDDFSQALIVQVRHKFPNDSVSDGRERRQRHARRRKKIHELTQIFAVIGNGMRRRILNRNKYSR